MLLNRLGVHMACYFEKYTQYVLLKIITNITHRAMCR